MIHNSLILIYIGDGKGKTTAAVGLAIRAAGAGKKVLFCQFVKAQEARESGEWPKSSEINILEKTPNIEVKILGRGFVGILGDTKQLAEHQKAARDVLDWLKQALNSGKYDLIVADELISAIEIELLTVAEVAEIITLAKAQIAAFALTGHNEYNELLEMADLVTEMKMVKHPYYSGRLAERGIDY